MAWRVSGYPDHQGGRRPSFVGEEIGSKRGRDLLRLHNEPVVEAAEPWLLAKGPPHHSPALDGRRP